MTQQFENEFVRGAIREIKLSNFLIYDNVAVQPGPHLNVIIGPNATGKSTIVNAICLGLAGKTTILGRAKDLHAYIKNGCDKAVIEIKLHNEGGGPYHIKRVLQRNATPNSSWYLNGRPAQLKQVEELVHSLNIQVSNLCQFLPQDRVADFVKMTNTELLTNTMLSANKELYDIHCQLKECQHKSNDVHKEFTSITEQLEREKTLNAGLEREVVNIEERQVHERNLMNLKEKRPWVEYEEYRRLHLKHKAEKEELEARHAAALKTTEPARRAVDILKRKQTEKLTEYRDIGQKILQSSRDVTAINETMQSFNEKIEEVADSFRSKENREKVRIKRIDAFDTQIDALEAQLASLVDTNVQPEIEQTIKEMRDLNRQKAKLDEQIGSLSSDKENIGHEIKSIEADLKKVRDVDAQKLNVVRRVDKHTHEAIMWLRNNRSDFEDVIYEPPIMTLNVKDRGTAKYVENCIGFNDLKTFICISRSDHEKFYRKMREEHHLVINAAVALSNGPDFYQPLVPVAEFRQYGFWSYVKDMVEAPDPVLAHLCHLSGLHRIPVGNHNVNDYLDVIPERCRGVSRYLSDSHSHSYKRSKYGDRNILTRSVDLRPATVLIHSVDESRLSELTQNLRELRVNEAELTKRIEELTLERNKVSERLERAQRQRKELIKRQSERKTLQEQLRHKRERRATCEADAIDVEAARQECKEQCEAIHTDRLKVLAKQADKTKTVVSRCKTRCKLGLENFAMLIELQKKEAEVAEKSTEVDALETELSEKREQLAKTKETAKRLQHVAKRVIGDMSGLSPEKQKVFKQLPSSLQELDAMIADTQARVDLIFVDTDRSVLEEFNNRKVVIEKLETRLAGRQASQTAHQDEILELKEAWLPPLQEIIDKINTQFSQYFKEIKCAGEIHLKVPANPDDFDSYGIGINVKYGNNKPMKELTTFQSGGERSVATVLYMLSLQELSSSPFRCVDEINQGMDAENERRVFELVVQTACKPSTPQYFLLTPKLLPDLLYTERMAIHIVHNGPYMLGHEQWNVNDFIAKRLEFEDH